VCVLQSNSCRIVKQSKDILQDFVEIARIIFEMPIPLSFKKRAGVRMGLLSCLKNPSPLHPIREAEGRN